MGGVEQTMQHHGTLVPSMLLSEGKTSLFLSERTIKPTRSCPSGAQSRRQRHFKACCFLKGCFSSSHQAKRRRQSAGGREGGREGAVTCFTATVAALLKLSSRRATGATYKAGLPACTQGAVGGVETGLRVGGKGQRSN